MNDDEDEGDYRSKWLPELYTFWPWSWSRRQWSWDLVLVLVLRCKVLVSSSWLGQCQCQCWGFCYSRPFDVILRSACQCCLEIEKFSMLEQIVLVYQTLSKCAFVARSTGSPGHRKSSPTKSVSVGEWSPWSQFLVLRSVLWFWSCRSALHYVSSTNGCNLLWKTFIFWQYINIWSSPFHSFATVV